MKSAKTVRSDHIWLKRKGDWKCCLCGAVTSQKPPLLPTPSIFEADRYEPLTDQERSIAPFKFGEYANQ